MYHQPINKVLNSIIKISKILDVFLIKITRLKFLFNKLLFTTILQPQVKETTQSLRNQEINDLAKYLGFTRTNEKVKGQFVYTDGRFFIVHDLDSHIGGVWKMARTPDDLRSKKTRLGTYDPLLTLMGD
ncbi:MULTISPECIES: toxin C-terminal domain-containing protein [Lysinibacillus]|uniref:toxin C-terminal domain-containing protein n=1 Tax=Lysinibacillus TaxID=400634 RepID=UPI00214A8F65|nr:MULTISPECIES: toxin C-terminal domain-containing protein [Lysinibacillus]UUV26025.1 toxin C-terminal domain-containing protein [Lysinibacillus sp. FN11]UYB48897.1 toxin C-terminal domain-containing protein [Lysinibacillus capsici]